MLSIIVPIYNTEKYLEECIKSILKQSYSDFELLLLDDGSTDNSWNICCKYAEKDDRIRIFHKENTGVSDTRNLGLHYARGEYISFCDSDDKIAVDTYKILFSNLKKYNVDRICGGYEYLYSNDRKVYCKPRLSDGIYKREELIKIMIDDGTLSGFLFSGVNNSIFKKQIIDNNHLRFDTKIKYNEDSLFSFQYMLCSNSLYSLQSLALYSYRQHEESTTKKSGVENKYSLLHTKLKSINKQFHIENFEQQMNYRYVTEALWKILDIGNRENGIFAVKHIKKIITNDKLCQNMKKIKTNKLNKYKKSYYYLMKFKLSFILYFLTKKIVPIVSKYISR